jgi:homoserine O-acetyltransferase
VQQRLLAEVFDIERVALVYGFSMGAQQAFHWAALFPFRGHCLSLRLSRLNRLRHR